MVRGAYDMPLDEERRCYEQGLAHFNDHDFFEAHEAWEFAWNGTSGRRSTFYQGLIQMAVALVHYQRRNRLGVLKVFERARGKWAGLPDVYMGLDLRDFEARMRDIVDTVGRAEPGEPPPVEPSRFFPIQLQYDPFTAPWAEAGD
ncbi:MAG: DUF309 domain-containing protein [Planctomycetes bacterium]|nr:DUF309 domain-containing protein [Planctomycetota bacterium]